MDLDCGSFTRKSSSFKQEWQTVQGKVKIFISHKLTTIQLLFVWFPDIHNIYRWHNHLDPMVRKSPWNDSEEFVFIEAHKLHGNKWAEIAKMIPGR